MDSKTPIVVTGSSGFVGSALVGALRREGFETVIGIDLFPSPTTNVEADFGDTVLIERCIPSGAQVIHLGGISTNGAAKADPVAAVAINCLSTMKFADTCRRAGASQFVFASSEWVYGDQETDTELSEESSTVDYLTNPSIYAQTKLATEGFLLSSDFFTNLTILRFAIVFGPRPNPSSAPESILADCRATRPVVIGNPQSARRFVFLDDLVEGIIAALGFPGHETFNLPGQDLISLGEIYDAATRVTGTAPPLLTDPDATPSIRNVSGERAKLLLGWESQITVAEGLRRI